MQPPGSASSPQPSFLAGLGIANVVAQDIAWVTAKEVEIVKSVCYAVAACLGLWLLHKWWYLRRYRRLRHKRLHFKSSTVSVAEEVFLPGISTWEGGMVCEANQFVPSSAVAQVLQGRSQWRARKGGTASLHLPHAALGWGSTAEALQKGTPRKRRGRSSVRAIGSAVPQSSPGRSGSRRARPDREADANAYKDPPSRSRSSRRAHSVRRGEGRGLLLEHEKTNFHESAFCSPTTRSPSFADTTTAAAAANLTYQLPRKKRICLKYHDGSSWSARSGFHPTRGCEFSGTGVDEVYGKVTISGVFCPRTQRIYWEEQAVSEGRSIEYAGAFKPSSHLARVSRKGKPMRRASEDAFEEDLTRLLNTSGGSSSPCRKSSSIQVGRTVSRKVPVAVSEERKCRERENREKGKRGHKSAIEVIPVTRRHEPAPKRRCQSEKAVAERMEGEQEVGEDCKVQVECTSSGSEWVDADSGSCSPVSTSSVEAHVQKSAEEYVGESRAGEDVAVETKLKEKKTLEKQDPSREGARVNIEEVTQKNSNAVLRITPELLREACLKNGGYENPLLNNSLCLNYKGLAKIEILGAYRNLHCLYLDCNGITAIEGLGHLENLKSLYLQSNCITKMENLPSSLMVLDLRQNKITAVAGLENCVHLSQLNLSKNSIMDVTALEGLLGLVRKEENQLVSVDLSANYMEEEDALVEFFTGGPVEVGMGADDLPGRFAKPKSLFSKLDCLFLQSNPSVRRIKNYRRRLVAGLGNLKFLDTKKVEEVERVGVQGWLKSGPEGEQEAKKEFILAERENKQRDLEKFRKVQELANKRLQKQLRRQEAEKAQKDAYDAGEGLPAGYVERNPLLAPAQESGDWVVLSGAGEAGSPSAGVVQNWSSPVSDRAAGQVVESPSPVVVEMECSAGPPAAAENKRTLEGVRNGWRAHPSTSSSSKGGTEKSTATANASASTNNGKQDVEDPPLTSENVSKLPFTKLDPSRMTSTVDNTGVRIAPSSRATSEAASEWYWSKLRDERLERLVAKSGYRFTVVAQKLNAEFNSTAITERMARERYGVLLRRLRAGNLGTVPEDETVGESSGASIGEQVGEGGGEANAAGYDAGAEPGDFQEMDAQRDRTRWWVRKLAKMAQSATSSSSSSSSTAAAAAPLQRGALPQGTTTTGRDEDLDSICTEQSEVSSAWISPGLCRQDFESFCQGGRAKSAVLAEAAKRGKIGLGGSASSTAATSVGGAGKASSYEASASRTGDAARRNKQEKEEGGSYFSSSVIASVLGRGGGGGGASNSSSRGKENDVLQSAANITERHPETGAEQEQHLDWHDHLLERYNEYFVGSRGAGASEEASGPFSYLQVEEAGREKQGKKKLALAVDSSSQNTEKQLAEEQRNSQGGKSQSKRKEETTGDGAKKDGASGTAIGVIIVIVIIVLLTALVIVLRFFVCADHFDESLKPVWSDGGEAGESRDNINKRPRKEPRGGMPKLLVSSMDAAGTAEVDDQHVRRGGPGEVVAAPPNLDTWVAECLAPAEEAFKRGGERELSYVNHQLREAEHGFCSAAQLLHPWVADVERHACYDSETMCAAYWAPIRENRAWPLDQSPGGVASMVKSMLDSWTASKPPSRPAREDDGTEAARGKTESPRLPYAGLFRPKSLKGVVDAVKHAAENGLRISVVSTGHSYIASNMREGQLLIDMGKNYPKFAHVEATKSLKTAPQQSRLGGVLDCALDVLQLREARPDGTGEVGLEATTQTETKGKFEHNEDVLCRDVVPRKQEFFGERRGAGLLRVGGGQIWNDVYAAVHEYNQKIVRDNDKPETATAPECTEARTKFHIVGGAVATVGAGGGYLQGGGLSGTTGMRKFGFAVDGVAQLEFVTAKGIAVRIWPQYKEEESQLLERHPQAAKVLGECYNFEDETWNIRHCPEEFRMYWKGFRGGGGGTWGVLTAVTYHLHEAPYGNNGKYVIYEAGGSKLLPLICDPGNADCKQAVRGLWWDFLRDFIFPADAPKSDAPNSDSRYSVDKERRKQEKRDDCGSSGISFDLFADGSRLSCFAPEGTFLSPDGGSHFVLEAWRAFVDDRLENDKALLGQLKFNGGTQETAEAALREETIVPCMVTADYFEALLQYAQRYYHGTNDAAERLPDWPTPSPFSEAYAHSGSTLIPKAALFAGPEPQGQEKGSNTPESPLRKWFLRHAAESDSRQTASSFGSQYLLGGQTRFTSDGLDAVPAWQRNEATYLLMLKWHDFPENLANNYRAIVYGDRRGSGEATAIISSSTQQSSIPSSTHSSSSSSSTAPAEQEAEAHFYPGGAEYNHIGTFEWGPRKDDWTEECPHESSWTWKRDNCLPVMEAVWGTELYRELLEAKRKLDPDGRFNCRHCVGDTRIPNSRADVEAI
eukprot:g8534.t1